MPRSIALGLLLVTGVASAGDKTGVTVTFGAGSLIIPGGAQFQDDCGQVSRFGLVYDLLRAEPYFQSAAGGGAPLHIYYIVDNMKKSPNRCIPVWKNDVSGNAVPVNAPPTTAGAPTYSSTWNDGCDFMVPNSGASPQPVVMMNVNSATHVTGVATIATNNTSTSSSVYPKYASAPVDATAIRVGYLGAPFIIDAADAPRVLALLAASPNTATDANGAGVDFSHFTNDGSCSFGNTHHVNLHQARVAFDAYVARDFSNTPPRLALLAMDTTHITNNIADGILEVYLANAGLSGFAGATGCPDLGALVGKTGCYAGTCCPSPNARGQIYDLFDIADLVNDKMSATDASGKRIYPMVWAPHWVGTGSATGGDAGAFTKLQSYLNNKVGLMGECASISTLEGAYNGGTADIKGGLQLQTCHAVAGACSGTTPYGIQRGNSAGSSNLRNCSDPNMTGGACAYYGHPTDSFSQIGDYLYNPQGGHVPALTPLSTTGSIYQPGVLPLISYISNLDPAKLDTDADARTMVIADMHTRSNKDNDPGKAAVVYVGGHDQSGTAAGTTLALETLLQLGAASTATDPPVISSDVSRASPSIAVVDGQTAMFQGTFTSLSTPATPLLVSVIADLATWEFPTIGGHMRARTTSSITNAATSFSSGTILFDAANGIPTPNILGCPSDFTTSCRTVFTTIDVPVQASKWATALRPANHIFKTSEATLIGGSIITGGLWAAAGWETLLSRVLAGDLQPDLTYKPKLGGVDHSTPAIIGQSPVIANSRPQIVYFGALDGMLHAFCADNTNGACAGALGKELWAFVPRTNLPNLVTNTARLDSSPRVMDMFGDFQATGTKSFHTLLWFVSSSNDPTTTNATPSVYEMDITDPAAPKVVWEYSVKTPGNGRNNSDLGNGLTIGAGVVQIAGQSRNVVWAETNDGGTTTSPGIVVDAIDADTGEQLWRFSYSYPGPHTTGDNSVPRTGLPGGVVPVDKQGNGYTTDIVFGDLYGNLWDLDPVTGNSKYGANTPLFQYSTDYHAIGGAPAIYAVGSTQYAVIVPGGFTDPNDANWGNANQTVVAVSLSTPTADATLTENSSGSDIGFKLNLGAGEKTFAQALVVGGQVFITSETTDVNSTTTFGTSGTATGKVYTYNVAAGTSSSVTVQNGAASLANNGTELYNSSGNAQQRLPTDATSATGTSVDSGSQQKVSRMLWLRTI